MKLRTYYTAIGTIWGAIIGFLIFISAAGAVAGFLWLYIFGDSSRPALEFLWSLVILIPLALWIAAIIVGASFGHAKGIDHEAIKNVEQERRVAYQLLMLSLIALFLNVVIVVAYVATETQLTQQARIQAKRIQQAITTYTIHGHDIESVQTSRSRPDTFTVRIRTTGGEPGAYDAAIEILGDAPITQSQTRVLSHGKETFDFTIWFGPYIDAFTQKRRVEPGVPFGFSGDVIVTATLTPRFEETESTRYIGTEPKTGRTTFYLTFDVDAEGNYTISEFENRP